MKDCHCRYRWRGDGPLEGASGEEAFGLEQAGGGWGGQNQKSIDQVIIPEIS